MTPEREKAKYPDLLRGLLAPRSSVETTAPGGAELGLEPVDGPG